MTTTKLGLPTIDGTMTADVVRDVNALAQAVDDKAGAPSGLAILDANSSVPAAQLGNVPVKSVNGETGDVVIQTFSGNYNDLSNKPFIPDTPDDIGAEPAITKKTAFNKDFGTSTGTVADGGVVAAHQADDAIDAHNATNISLIDTDAHFTATDVEGALSELFTNVSSGKQEVATAITDKGGTVADADADGVPTFQELTDGVNTLGKYKSGDILPLTKAGFPNGFKVGYGGNTGYDIRGGAPMHRSNKLFIATTNTNNYFIIYNIDRNSYSVSNQVISSNVPSAIAFSVVTDQNDNIYMNTQSTGTGHGMRKYDYFGNFLTEDTNLPASIMSCDDIDSIYCYQSGLDIKRIDYDLNTIWTVSLSAATQGLKAVSDGVIYSIYDGTTMKLGKLDKNGIQVFEVDTSSMGYFTNAHVDSEGNIYFEYANKITKLDSSGNFVWSAVSSTNMSNSFTVNETTGHIYWRSNSTTLVNSQQGYMRVINISDGTEVTSGIFTIWSNPDGSFYSVDDFIATQNNGYEVVFIDGSTYANVYRVAGILE